MDRYIIEKDIGIGGTAKVKKASDTVTGNSVALKMIDKKKITRAEFENEVRILSHLRDNCQEYILCYVDSFEAMYKDGNYYIIVTEDLSSYNELLDIIIEKPYLKNIDFYQQVMANIIKGFIIIRDKSVVHRDIKPENILVNKEGNIKFIDYGGSCIKGSCDDDGHYTLSYVPPEYTNKWSEDEYEIEKIQGDQYLLSDGNKYYRRDLYPENGYLEIGSKVFTRINQKDYDASVRDIWSLGSTLWTIVNNNMRSNIVYGKRLTENNIEDYLKTYPFLPTVDEKDTEEERKKKNKAIIHDKRALNEVSKIVLHFEREVEIEDLPMEAIIAQLRNPEIPLINKFIPYSLYPNLTDMLEQDPSKRKLGVIKDDEDTL